MNKNSRRYLLDEVEEAISSKLNEIENKVNEAIAEIELSGMEDKEGIEEALNILRQLSSDLY